MVFRAPGPAAVCAGGRRSSCLLFVAPTDLRPPRGLPARFGRRAACPPASAVRAASFARRVASKPCQAPQASRRPPIGRGDCVLSGLAPPPPTGTAAGPSGLLLVAPMVFRVPSGPAAREARRPHVVRRRASKPARALRSLRHPPHRRGLSLCVTRLGPALAPQALLWRSRTSLLSSSISHAIPPTTLSNHEFTTLELQRFQILLKLHPIELHASFLRGGRMGACWWRSWRPLARCAVA